MPPASTTARVACQSFCTRRQVSNRKKIKAFDFRQCAASNALKVTVQTSAGIKHALQLFFALGPDPNRRLTLATEGALHLGKFFNDDIDALPELWAGEILIDHFHL